MTIEFADVAAKLVSERAAGNWRPNFTIDQVPMTMRIEVASATEIVCVRTDGQRVTLCAADVASIAFVPPA
jgi:hypothetical protein